MSRIINKNKYGFKSVSFHRGMTLIELLVVLSIFMLVTSVTMFDFGTFRSSLSTQNLANDIALAVRKAQSYAIGSHGVDTSGVKSFSYGYGIHFTSNPTLMSTMAGSSKSFVMFVDLSSPANYLYDIPSMSNCGDVGIECNEILSITTADFISDIYLNGTTRVPNVGSLDISFKRPNPEAKFCYRPVYTDTSCDSGTITNVDIKISSANNKTRTISVWNTGQISIR